MFAPRVVATPATLRYTVAMDIRDSAFARRIGELASSGCGRGYLLSTAVLFVLLPLVWSRPPGDRTLVGALAQAAIVPTLSCSLVLLLASRVPFGRLERGCAAVVIAGVGLEATYGFSVDGHGAAAGSLRPLAGPAVMASGAAMVVLAARARGRT